MKKRNSIIGTVAASLFALCSMFHSWGNSLRDRFDQSLSSDVLKHLEAKSYEIPVISRPDMPRAGAVEFLQAARRQFSKDLKEKHPCHEPWGIGGSGASNHVRGGLNRRARRDLCQQMKFA